MATKDTNFYQSFLTKRSIVKPLHAELDLCLLSVSYLNFPEFSESFSPAEIRQALIDGRYALYEYAVSCWAFHLTSAFPNKATHDEEESGLLSELRETLGPFLDQHYSKQGPRSVISKKIRKQLNAFEDLDFFDSLIQAVIWTRKQTAVNQTSENDDDDTFDFPRVTGRIRSALEDLIASGLDPGTLQLYYGSNLYKCPKGFCQHFVTGFGTKSARDEHVDRHERAYPCSFEGCPMATFGCVSQQKLDAHLRDNHGVRLPQENFPDVSDPRVIQEADEGKEEMIAGEQTEVPIPADDLRCEVCDTIFIRKDNLRAHIQTRHTHLRLHRCEICHKSFARRNDLTRHSRTHLGSQKSICEGCGRGYNRPDALMAHLRTVAGQTCAQKIQAAQESNEGLGNRNED